MSSLYWWRQARLDGYRGTLADFVNGSGNGERS